MEKRRTHCRRNEENRPRDRCGLLIRDGNNVDDSVVVVLFEQELALSTALTVDTAVTKIAKKTWKTMVSFV